MTDRDALVARLREEAADCDGIGLEVMERLTFTNNDGPWQKRADLCRAAADALSRETAGTCDQIAAKLTDEILRRVANTMMASTMGYANKEGYCDCNGCERYREHARAILVAALAPIPARPVEETP